MKNLLIALGIAVVLVAGFFAFNAYIYNEKQETSEVVTTYISPEYGFSFMYRESPYGYRVEETLPGAQDDPTLKKVLLLMLQSDYEELQNSSAPREGPPVIAVGIYEKNDTLSADEWLAEHPYAASLDLVISGMYPVTVGGVEGLRFTTDGLYVTENVLVEHNGYMYHFAGQYADTVSLIAEDFDPFLASVTLN